MTNTMKPNINIKSFEGKTLQGKYLLQEYIGGGNFSAVFKSQQSFLGVPIRRVAVKVSKLTGFNIEKAREIFADVFMLAEAMDEITDTEARSHLVHIYDAGILPDEDNRIFAVMEYVHGTNLAQQFESLNRVPADILLKWVRQICQTLKELHTLVPPLIHRDLKPDNILLEINSNVRVVDFGLAARLITKGYVPGTLGPINYMAPETTQGESVPASDVYTIGLLMFQGLTGQLPFAHLIPPLDMPQVMYSDWLYKQKSMISPVSASSLNNTVSPQLDAIVLRCLEFYPSKRFFNAGELLKALDELYIPPTEPKDVTALKEGRQIKNSGDMKRALLCFEHGLGIPSSSKEIRFHLLYEFGKVLVDVGDYSQATARLVEAWELTKDSAILRTRQERIDLLKKIVDTFKKSGNDYQANRFEKLVENELKSGGN